MTRKALAAAWLVASLVGAGPLAAAPVIPRDDAEVVEVLPASIGSRADERRWRRETLAHLQDPAAATALARQLLERAREQSDPRYAGQALALLQRWSDPVTAPDDVLLMQATVEQYLHAFDAAATKLERLVARSRRAAQAWLTLATVRRVQGRYQDSDVACRALAGIGAGLYAAACLAENDALQGRADTARTALERLLATPRLPAETANWLYTTLAELEARAGRLRAAEIAYRAALAAHADGYTTISYADFLLQCARYTDALTALRGQARSDAVLLRLAIAGTRAGTQDGPRDAREMRERIALANERPDARVLHAREQAMFALWVDNDPARAVELARANVRQQREPVDFLVLVFAARAAGDPAALLEAERLRRDIGLVDPRLDGRGRERA